MKLAFDLDDILASFQLGWVKFNAEKYNSTLTYDDIVEYDYSKVFKIEMSEAIRRIFEFYDSGLVSELTPVPGAVGLINSLKDTHELYVLTSRPKEIEDITVNWIERYYPKTFKEVLLTGQISRDGHNHKVTKADLCLKYDFGYLIDDAPIYAQQVAAVDKNVIVVSKPWNRSVIFESSRIHRVDSIEEVAGLVNAKSDLK